MFLFEIRKMFRDSRHGQAALEYIILYTAVVIALIIFLSGKTSFFAKSYNSALGRSTNSITVVTNRILR